MKPLLRRYTSFHWSFGAHVDQNLPTYQLGGSPHHLFKGFFLFIGGYGDFISSHNIRYNWPWLSFLSTDSLKEVTRCQGQMFRFVKNWFRKKYTNPKEFKLAVCCTNVGCFLQEAKMTQRKGHGSLQKSPTGTFDVFFR